MRQHTIDLCDFVVHLSVPILVLYFIFFFFNDTATTEIYTLSLHDALPISQQQELAVALVEFIGRVVDDRDLGIARSEEHTSELQSLAYLVCRLLLEKKKKTTKSNARSRPKKTAIDVKIYGASGRYETVDST